MREAVARPASSPGSAKQGSSTSLSVIVLKTSNRISMSMAMLHEGLLSLKVQWPLVWTQGCIFERLVSEGAVLESPRHPAWTLDHR